MTICRYGSPEAADPLPKLSFLKARLIQEPWFSRGSRPPASHQLVGVLVPAAVGEIVAEHGGGGLRLVDDAERHIGLGQPGQRLLDVARASDTASPPP